MRSSSFALALVMAFGSRGGFGGGPNGYQGATRRATEKAIMQHERLQAIADRNSNTAPRARRVRRVARLREEPARGDRLAYDVTVQPFLYDAFRELETPEFQRSRPRADFVANEEFITMDYSDTGDVTGTLVPTNDIVIRREPGQHV